MSSPLKQALLLAINKCCDLRERRAQAIAEFTARWEQENNFAERDELNVRVIRELKDEYESNQSAHR